MSIAALQAEIRRLQAENEKFKRYIERLEAAKRRASGTDESITDLNRRTKLQFDNPIDWDGDTRDRYEDILGEDIKGDYKTYGRGVDRTQDEMSEEIRELKKKIMANNARIAACRAQIAAIRAARARAAAAAANSNK